MKTFNSEQCNSSSNRDRTLQFRSLLQKKKKCKKNKTKTKQKIKPSHNVEEFKNKT